MSSFADANEKYFLSKSHAIAKEMAEGSLEELKQETTAIIRQFYKEYTPKEYVRHSPKGMFKTVIFNFSDDGAAYIIKIAFLTRRMYTDYDISNEYVLDSFLNGWHGPSWVGINYGTMTYEHISKYCDTLIVYYSSLCK